MAEYLLLKWGSLKAWKLKTEKSMQALQKWADGGVRASAMAQHDTQEQKQALCKLIDVVDGEITNDWSGEKMTKEEAKTYIMEYK